MLEVLCSVRVVGLRGRIWITEKEAVELQNRKNFSDLVLFICNTCKLCDAALSCSVLATARLSCLLQRRPGSFLSIT